MTETDNTQQPSDSQDEPSSSATPVETTDIEETTDAEETANAEETTKAEYPAQEAPDLTAFAAAIAEAEERGFKRGQEQALQHQQFKIPTGDNNPINSTPTFLSHIRTGFWD
jgi:flagellar biosynthesis/type III secretory pathway protein FliH